MKNQNLNLSEYSLSELSNKESEAIIGGSIGNLFYYAGYVVGSVAAVVVGAVGYGLSHPSGINAGMENVH